MTNPAEGAPQSHVTAWFLAQPRDSAGFFRPPWRVYWWIPRGSIGWRIGGPADDYMHEWCGWYAQLDYQQRRHCRRRYWPDPIWWDHYLVGEQPLWLQALLVVHLIVVSLLYMLPVAMIMGTCRAAVGLPRDLLAIAWHPVQYVGKQYSRRAA